MKVFVTGATGFLGSHIAEKLLQGGHSVRALVRATSKTEHLRKIGVECVQADLGDTSALQAAIGDADAVVHAAGIVKALNPDDFFRVNGQGAGAMVEAAKLCPNVRRFVYVSSLAAHGFSEDGKARSEDAPPRPVTNYGRSKLEGEKLVLAQKDQVHVTVIRPPAIYGPRDIEMLVFFRSIARRFAPFMGSAENLLSLVYVEDCARSIVAALEGNQESGRVYFVEDGEVYTQGQFRQAVERALQVRALPFPVPLKLLSFAAFFSESFGRLARKPVMLTRDKVNELRQPYIVCSSARIQKELGWRPEVQLEDGARRTAEWYRQNGML